MNWKEKQKTKFNRTKNIFKGSAAIVSIVVTIIFIPISAIEILSDPNSRHNYVKKCVKAGESKCHCFKKYHIEECLKETNNSYESCVIYADNNAMALDIKGC